MPEANFRSAQLILGPPLVLGLHLDTALFGAGGESGAANDLDHLADAAVDVFLAAYR